MPWTERRADVLVRQKLPTDHLLLQLPERNALRDAGHSRTRYSERMDGTSLKAQLEQAQRDVVAGESIVARQKALIVYLQREGHDITVASELLRAFEKSQTCNVTDRDRLLARLRAAGV